MAEARNLLGKFQSKILVTKKLYQFLRKAICSTAKGQELEPNPKAFPFQSKSIANVTGRLRNASSPDMKRYKSTNLFQIQEMLNKKQAKKGTTEGQCTKKMPSLRNGFRSKKTQQKILNPLKQSQNFHPKRTALKSISN